MSQEKPRTVRVRIAVAVERSGEWDCSGWGHADGPAPDESMLRTLDHIAEDAQRYFITAEIPIPERAAPIEVAAEVEAR